MNKLIPVGSQVFFSKFSDYESHDKDYVQFEDNPKLCKLFMTIRGKGKDIFYYKSMNKLEFLNFELKHCLNLPMAAGKFLIPELIEYLGLTLNDLKKFEFAFDNIDKKHSYEKFIYDSYISNNKFELTDDQLSTAYELYKLNKQ